jgi:hypothetical protein
MRHEHDKADFGLLQEDQRKKIYAPIRAVGTRLAAHFALISWR